MEYKHGIVTKIYHTDCAYQKVIVEDRTMVIGSAASANLDIKEVFLPESIASIESYAFLDCENLESINFPTNLKTIGERSFAGCKSLKKIILPEGLTSIGASAFVGCESLEEIELPSTIEEIKYRTFADCKNLKKIIIRDSVKNIQWGAFSGCENLEEIIIPNSVKSLGNQLFLNCKKLTKILLPESLTSLPDETFMGCISLEDYILPSHITKIGNSAFANCVKLKHFPEQVEEFGHSSFKNCRNLTTININKKVKTIPDNMFNGCIKLKNIKCRAVTVGKKAFRSCISLEEVPSSIYTYGSYAFEKCINLKEITIIGNSVSEGAFRNCKKLEKIYVANNISTLGPRAFANCTKLESFECFDYLKNIPASTFENCKNLTSISLNNIINRIGKRAFYGCKKLKKISLPECLETIDNNALSGCNSIKKIYIPAALKNIGTGAFSYMKSLEYIKVSAQNKTFTTYDNLSLMHCEYESLIQYAIGSKNKQYSIEPFSWHVDELNREIIRQTKSISQYAFAGASNLEELTLISSVDNLEKTAFDNCENLKTLYVKRLPMFSNHGFRIRNNGNYDWDNGDFPFENIILDDNIIGLETRAFTGFKKIKKLHLPNKELRLIKPYSFYDAKELKEAFIPSCVADISEKAFAKSTTLKFANNLEIIGSNFINLQTRDESKVYKLKDNTYYVDKNNKIIHISEEEIKKLCSNSELVINTPDILLNYMELMKKYGKNNDLLMNGILISSFNNNNARRLIKNYDSYSEEVINNSRILLESNTPNSKEILKKPEKLLDYIDLLKKYEIKDNTLMNAAFIAAFEKDEAEIFIKNYDANIKRLIKESKILSNLNTASENIKDLFNLMKIMAIFEDDAIVKQRSCTFITEKIFAEFTIKTKKNDNRIIGDDIHRTFNNIIPREEVDYKFIRFFITNYQEIYNFEKKHSGFIQRTYNNFINICKTSTSDRGEQRNILVTVDKCYTYLISHKFSGVTKENEELAKTLGQWFDEDSAFQNAISVLKESQTAPRNIFTKFIVVENQKLIFDNNPKNDLIEPINKNYSYEWLNKQSTENLLLGKYCNCCAHINGQGTGIMRASMISDSCQNLIIRNEQNEIIAKSTLYVNKQAGYGVFNNVESNILYNDDINKEKIYNAFIRGTEAFLTTYNKNNPQAQINLITIGLKRNTIVELLEEKNEIHPVNSVLQAVNYGNYSYNNYGHYNGDSSQNQRLVMKKINNNL